MISLWITIGLIIAASLVSTLGAYFSVFGIGALFSGAFIAVCLMAGSLELAKFVMAAYLHQAWKKINIIFKVYMTFSVIVLSSITSIGIFGFLSDAYQSTSLKLDAENLKLDNLKKQIDSATSEIDRLQYSVEEIPEDRITKKLQARAAIEPRILELNKKIEDSQKEVADTNIRMLDIKKKVGPLIYIARAMNTTLDQTVKYLILIFVMVFDPLAICLVIAATFALDSRRNPQLQTEQKVETKPDVKVEVAAKVETKPEVKIEAQTETKKDEVVAPAAKEIPSDEVIVQMNFKDESLNNQPVESQTVTSDKQEKPKVM